MKLTKIGYNSAVVFSALGFVMYFFIGILQWSMRDILIASGVPINAVSVFVTTPITGGIIGYLSVLIVIAIYNLVAKKYPIAWEVSKK